MAAAPASRLLRIVVSLRVLAGRERWRKPGLPASFLLLTVGLWLAPVSSASAHSVLVRTEPERAVSVASAPALVQLDFNERPRARFSVVHVMGPDGQRRDVGTLSVRDDTVFQPLAGTRPAGVYVVNWRVVSSDGHPISGQWQFTSTAAAPSIAVPAAAPASGSGTRAASSSSWERHLVHALLGVGVAAVIGAGALRDRLRRRRREVRS